MGKPLSKKEMNNRIDKVTDKLEPTFAKKKRPYSCDLRRISDCVKVKCCFANVTI